MLEILTCAHSSLISGTLQHTIFLTIFLLDDKDTRRIKEKVKIKMKIKKKKLRHYLSHRWKATSIAAARMAINCLTII